MPMVWLLRTYDKKVVLPQPASPRSRIETVGVSRPSINEVSLYGDFGLVKLVPGRIKWLCRARPVISVKKPGGH